MPTYEHLCKSCEHEWEEFYSIKADPPTVCPSCEEEGSVERLISGGSGKGIMVLTGHELKGRIFNDAMKARKRAATDENYRANIIGEDKYHQRQLKKDSLQNDLVKIGQNASKIKSTDTKPAGVVKRVSSGKE
jgi:putative FmdB family regulatory protein